MSLFVDSNRFLYPTVRVFERALASSVNLFRNVRSVESRGRAIEGKDNAVNTKRRTFVSDTTNSKVSSTINGIKTPQLDSIAESNSRFFSSTNLFEANAGNPAALLPYDESLRQPKAPGGSNLCVRYSFSKNPAILKEYRKFDGGVRIGKLLEDMDTCSGDVAARHVFLDNAPRNADGRMNMRMPDNVTGCVDAIDVFCPSPNLEMFEKDMIIEGSMIWTGSSSMLIRSRIWIIDGKWQPNIAKVEGISHGSSGDNVLDDENVNEETNGIIISKHKSEGAQTAPSIAHRTSDDTSAAMKRLYVVASQNEFPDKIGLEHTGIGSEKALKHLMPPLEERQLFMQGDFLFVALSPERKPLKINPLELGNWEEQELFDWGEKIKEKRAKMKATSLEKLTPNYEEMQYIHEKYKIGILGDPNRHFRDMFSTATNTTTSSQQRSQVQALNLAGEKIEDWLPVSQTRLRSVTMTHTEEQNSGGKIFGGQLMKRATELANQTVTLFWSYGRAQKSTEGNTTIPVANTSSSTGRATGGTNEGNNKGPGVAMKDIFEKSGVSIVCIDDIEFVRPVSIGSLMSFEAVIGFVEGDHCCAMVTAEIYDYNQKVKFTSNRFSVTLKTNNGQPFLPVFPVNYSDMILHLTARRKLKKYFKKREADLAKRKEDLKKAKERAQQ